jgi:hypothetical protein
MPRKNVSFTADFELIEYSVSLSANPSNGAILTGAGNYTIGQVVNISANEPNGYLFDEWTGADVNLLTNSGSLSTSFNMPAKSVSFVANYSTAYNLTILIEGNGTTSPASGTHQYKSGEIASVTATPDNNWVLTHWLYDTFEYITNPMTVTMNGNKTITAVFTTTDNISTFSNEIFSIYPNPSTGIFNLIIDKEYYINISDVLGKTILEQTINIENNIIDLTSYSSGVYLLKLKNNDNVQVIKLIKE